MPNDNILDYYRKRTVYSYKLPYTYRNVRYYYRKRTVMYCTVQFYDIYCTVLLKYIENEQTHSSRRSY